MMSLRDARNIYRKAQKRKNKEFFRRDFKRAKFVALRDAALIAAKRYEKMLEIEVAKQKAER